MLPTEFFFLQNMHLIDSNMLETEWECIKTEQIFVKLKGVRVDPNPILGRQDMLLFLQNSLANRKKRGYILTHKISRVTNLKREKGTLLGRFQNYKQSLFPAITKSKAFSVGNI